MRKSLAEYEQALAHHRASGDALKVAHTIRHIGDIHLENARLDLAEPCFVEALTIYRAHPEAPALDLANAVRPMALLREQQARQLWAEARELYERVQVDAGVREASARLARLT